MQHVSIRILPGRLADGLELIFGDYSFKVLLKLDKQCHKQGCRSCESTPSAESPTARQLE